MSTPVTLNYTTSSAVTAWNGLAYAEITKPGSWTATLYNNQPSEASRVLICHWSDLVNFTAYLLGNNNFTTTSGFITTYVVGAMHPHISVFCDSVQVDAYTGVASAESTFDYAQLTVHYKSLPFTPGGSATAVREDTVEDIGEVIMIPKATLISSSPGGDGIPQHPSHDVPFYLPILKITSTLLGVSTVPLGAIVAAKNHLSSSDLTFNFGGTSYTITANTILYCGATTKRTVLSNGTSKYDVTHVFIVSPIHNKVIDPTSTATDIISRFVLPPDGFVNYLTTSFAGLGV